MTVLLIEARNTAPDSPNPIHTEEARQHGFRGGIVPGLTLYGYMVRAVVDEWGTGWLEEGQLESRFRQPVYDGDPLTVTADPDGDDLVLSITNAEGTACATGRARRRRDRDAPDVADFPSRLDDDEPLVEGTPEVLGRLPQLKDYLIDTDPAYVRDYLGQLEESHPIYDSILHPVVIARVSAYIVGRRYEFGPRIHTLVRTRFLTTSPIDAVLTARGRIADVWERKGNWYLRSDLLVVDADERPIMQIDSESIFQLGGRA